MSLFDSEIPDDVSTEKKLDEMTKQLIKDPNNSALNKAYARTLLDNAPNLKRAKIALKSLEIVLSQDPENWDAKMLVVRALRWMNRHDDALMKAEEINLTINNSAFLFNEIGRIYMDKNEPELGLIKLDEGIKKYPNDGKIMRSLIRVLTDLSVEDKNSSKLERAMEICNRGLDETPNQNRFAGSKIELLYELEKYNELVEFIEEFQKKYPKEFMTPMFTSKSEILTVALDTAYYYTLIAKKMFKNSVSKNHKEQEIEKILEDNPKIIELHEKSIKLLIRVRG